MLRPSSAMLPVAKRATRPVEKEIWTVLLTANTTATIHTLHTSVVAETFSGGHISGTIETQGTAGNFVIALLFVPDGITTPALGITDNVALCEPEQFVLWAKVVNHGSTTSLIIPLDIKIKTMRKMKTGDRIILTTDTNVSSCATLGAAVTLFYKQ